AVTEDTTTTASGSLSVSDVDTGEAVFQASSAAGTYGSFSIGADGTGECSVNNAAANVQSLPAGAHASENFTGTSFDGTATQVITSNITGTNDAAAISGTATGAVTEDTTTTASGSLSVSDVDTGEAVFQASSATGTYGSFSIGADGNWTYSLNNAAANVQSLPTAAHATETLTANSFDVTATQLITINITG